MAMPEIKVRVTADTDQAKSGLKSVEKSLDSVNAKQKAATASGRQFARSMSASSAQTANLGAQLNDIGIMLAAGQSPLQLAVQQGTQINQVFAQMGGGKAALRGLAAGFVSMANPMSLATIGIIAGGAALVQWGVSALGASEEAEKLAERQEELIDIQARLAAGLRQATLGATAEELTLLDAIAAKRQEVAEWQEQVDNAGAVRTRMNAEADLGYAQDELSALEAQYAELQRLQSAEQALVASTRERSAQELIVGNNVGLTVEKLAEADAMTELLRQGLSASAIEALQLAGVDLVSGVDAAAAAAATLAANLNISLQEALKLKALSADPLGAFGGAGPFVPESSPSWEQQGIDAARSNRRGGGGGAANAMAARLEALVESLKTEREVLEEWRTEGLELLATANEAELEALGGHLEAKLRLEEEYQERLSRIKKAGANEGLLTTLKAGQDIANAIGRSNERALKIAQSFGAAISLINAYQAASETLKDPSLPWYARISAAASVLAAGIGFVNSIRSVSSSGGGAGAAAGGAGGGASAAPQQPAPRRLAEFRVEGSNVRGLSALVDDINEAVRSGYQINIEYAG